MDDFILIERIEFDYWFRNKNILPENNLFLKLNKELNFFIKICKKKNIIELYNFLYNKKGEYWTSTKPNTYLELYIHHLTGINDIELVIHFIRSYNDYRYRLYDYHLIFLDYFYKKNKIDLFHTYIDSHLTGFDIRRLNLNEKYSGFIDNLLFKNKDIIYSYLPIRTMGGMRSMFWVKQPELWNFRF